MLCKKCGASVPDTTYECPFCNAKLADKPPVEEEEVVAVEEETVEEVADNEEIFDENELKRREQIQKMLDEKQQQLSEIQDRREQKRKKQQRKKILIIAAICVLVSIAVGCGAYLISNSTSGRNNVTISTPSPEPTVDPAATEIPAPTLDPSISPLPIETLHPVDSLDTPVVSEPGTGTASTGAASAGASSTSSTGSASTGTSSTTKSSTNKSGTKSNTNKSSTTKSSTAKATAKPSTTKITNTGITKVNLSGMVAKGGKIVLDSASGKYVMSFISGSTEYFAYVSEGSTTAQIANKTLGVTAVPTENTYKGSTVYEISDFTIFEGDYIIKDSGIRLLTEADIAGLSKAQLGYARNEIFARHGRPFKTQKYKDYFAKCSWYKVNPNYNLNDDKSNLSEIERANVDFIIAQENK